MASELSQANTEPYERNAIHFVWIEAAVLAALIALALLYSLGFALEWYCSSSKKTGLSISQRKDLLQGLASAVQALAVTLTGTVGLVGLFFTWQNLKQARESTEKQLQLARESQERTEANTQEALRLSEEGQITERYTRAIEQLGATDGNGEKRLEIRLGGIYALERIARDSPQKDSSTVIEVFTAYVRQNAQKLVETPPPFGLV